MFAALMCRSKIAKQKQTNDGHTIAAAAAVAVVAAAAPATTPEEEERKRKTGRLIIENKTF